MRKPNASTPPFLNEDDLKKLDELCQQFDPMLIRWIGSYYLSQLNSADRDLLIDHERRDLRAHLEIAAMLAKVREYAVSQGDLHRAVLFDFGEGNLWDSILQEKPQFDEWKSEEIIRAAQIRQRFASDPDLGDGLSVTHDNYWQAIQALVGEDHPLFDREVRTTLLFEVTYRFLDDSGVVQLGRARMSGFTQEEAVERLERWAARGNAGGAVAVSVKQL